MGTTVTYYHYTDREGLKGILRERRIRMSTTGIYGKGVYFTTLPPELGRKRIAQNNWDGIWQVTEYKGKVDYTISVELPENKMQRFGDIYLYPEDVNLDETTYRLYSKHNDHHELE